MVQQMTAKELLALEQVSQHSEREREQLELVLAVSQLAELAQEPLAIAVPEFQEQPDQRLVLARLAAELQYRQSFLQTGPEVERPVVIAHAMDGKDFHRKKVQQHTGFRNLRPHTNRCNRLYSLSSTSNFSTPM